jgi:type IV pilus assembly protein PilM
MFLRRNRTRPIAVDIGSGSLKLVQAGGANDRQIIAATERAVPAEVTDDWNSMVQWLSTALPECLDEVDFIGRRMVIALPSNWTTVQHIQVDPEDLPLADQIAAASLPELEEEPMTRIIHVGDFLRKDRMRSEIICMAFPRPFIFNLVELLHRRGMEVMDLRTQVCAMVGAFDHLHRRTEDAAVATMYVDLGTGGTNCAITNGGDLVSARRINIGGRHFDQAVAKHLGCDMEAARAYRIAHELSEQNETAGHTEPPLAEDEHLADRRRNMRPSSLGSPMAPLGLGSGGVVPDCPDLLETIVDELRMAIRYDAGLFPDRSLERIVFLGSGAQSDRTCRHIVQALQVPGQRGDPLARYDCPPGTRCPSNWNGNPRPSWAVSVGLFSKSRRKEHLHA